MGPMYNPDNVSPVEWLRENTYNQPTHTLPASRLEALIADKPRAAFVALVRNSEEVGMVHSILQVEARFNSRKTHRYDWVFFNNEPFTEAFKSAVTNATSSTVHFEQIDEDHWRMPDWIDKSRYDVGRQFQGSIGVGKAWLESYHQMCRWNSGLFALEARLMNYDWYWRVEPDVSVPRRHTQSFILLFRLSVRAYLSGPHIICSRPTCTLILFLLLLVRSTTNNKLTIYSPGPIHVQYQLRCLPFHARQQHGIRLQHGHP
jgi:hypothetical protein